MGAQMKERESVTKIRRYWKRRGPLDLALGGPIIRYTFDFLEK